MQTFNVTRVTFDTDWWIISSNNTITTGLAENKIGSDFSVYPNPATSTITILPDHIINSTLLISITDVLGKTISENSYSGFPYKVDITKLDQGVYFVKMSDGENHIVRRFVK